MRLQKKVLEDINSLSRNHLRDERVMNAFKGKVGAEILLPLYLTFIDPSSKSRPRRWVCRASQ